MQTNNAYEPIELNNNEHPIEDVIGEIAGNKNTNKIVGAAGAAIVSVIVVINRKRIVQSIEKGAKHLIADGIKEVIHFPFFK